MLEEHKQLSNWIKFLPKNIQTYLSNRKFLIGVVVVGGIALFPALYSADWTGFGMNSNQSKSIEKMIKDGQTISIKETVTEHFQSGKTLWDWLGLGGTLAIPVILFQFERREQRRSEERVKAEKEQAEKQAVLEKDIADDNLREEVLQAYLDRMSELLLDKNLSSSTDPNDPVRDMARIRTLTILRRLDKDGERKGSVMRFLSDAELVSKLDLNSADLSGANLSDANLSNTNLSGTNLNSTDLTRISHK